MAKTAVKKRERITVGRRKESVARVIAKPGKGKITINGRKFGEYFPRLTHQIKIMAPIKACGVEKKYDFVAKVDGGGITGQTGAVVLGIARALVAENADFQPILKKGKFLTRDPRMVERKKYGRHKARKSHQFSKR